MSAADWEIVGHIATVASIIESAAVAAAAILAFATINAWRKENTGKRKFEIAEQVLLAAANLRERVVDVRTPLKAPDGMDAEAAFEFNRSHYYNRLGYIGSFAGDDSLVALRPIFRVYFGLDAGEPIDRLLAVAQRINRALTEIFVAIPASGSAFSPRNALLEQLGWGEGPRPDAIDVELDAAIKSVEELIRPVIEGKQ